VNKQKSVIACVVVSGICVVASLSMTYCSRPSEMQTQFDLNADGSVPDALPLEWDAAARCWRAVRPQTKPRAAEQLTVFCQTESDGVVYGLIGRYSMFRFAVSREADGEFSIPCWKTKFDTHGNVVDGEAEMPGLIQIPIELGDSSAIAKVPSIEVLEKANWQRRK